MQRKNRQNWLSRWRCLNFLLAAVACSGCASTRLTDTSRTGMEQLLVSKAIDTSLDKIDFESLAGGAVFVDEKYLECNDKKYVIGAVRQRAFQAGCRLVDKPDDADIVLELYSGAVGTDRSEGFIGTPTLSVPGPLPIQLPEIKLISQTTQYGTAKLGMVAYDAKTKQALSAGGLIRARSDSSNWTLLGLGPFKSGSVREDVALAKKLRPFEKRIMLSDRTINPMRHANIPAPSAHASRSPSRDPAPYGPRPSNTMQPNQPPPDAQRDFRVSNTPPWSVGESHRMPNSQESTRFP